MHPLTQRNAADIVMKRLAPALPGANVLNDNEPQGSGVQLLAGRELPQ